MVAIGEAAQRSGINIETIRFYEREGVIAHPPRTANGRRVYNEEAIAELTFIRRCRDLGFPLSDVRALLALSRDRAADCDAVREVGMRHLEDVRAKISELHRLEAALEELTANCAADSLCCPMLDDLRSEPGRSKDRPSN